MTAQIWVLGGTGRSGREIAAQLARLGLTAVLVGRDPNRLRTAARPTGSETLLAPTFAAAVAEIRRQHPAVVINAVGPFTTTAPEVIDACRATGSHYIDLANDVEALSAVYAMHDAATQAGHALVTGAGFGVTATESVVAKLCEGRPAPFRVRVDMVPSIAMEEGTAGEALIGTLLGSLRGRRITDGRLVPVPIFSDAVRLTLPDGAQVTTASMPAGELLAAHRASGARHVLSASSEAPSSPLIRAMMPALSALMRWERLRSFATRRLARVRVRAKERPRDHSWGHAVVTWANGETREGWLRLGDAQEYTGAVPAEIARRLLDGEGRPGAHTPAALFGPALAESCGAAYLLPELGR
ncbi:saccharopine dehydrogenase NADP-binding domain-containing protein [Saccharopolyspora sp. TS4A08]|uniref:Saccharopine dehydrogenase NADP-binding domain-containing protein n=1 Tax=Saccharopolyspora ipomoeae TaxID=3042027 RepID=A0ABT6PUN9_9PSEU|nr:saccharopine dehydrogenase NADP-binding domain-containing protein [Saccharopolyspora sp. TS4A08]MDI2031708.1 saccharopine dehydrogenase NADP-binding domain-containing protein [Saccharopolyspora sp. TS4A08]